MKRKRTPATFGWVVQKRVGFDRSVKAYLETSGLIGSLTNAEIFANRLEAERAAFWNCASVRLVKVQDGERTVVWTTND